MNNNLTENNYFQFNYQCQNVFQLNFDSSLKKPSNRTTFPYLLKMGIRKRGSNIFDTGHMAGSAKVVPLFEN